MAITESANSGSYEVIRHLIRSAGHYLDLYGAGSRRDRSVDAGLSHGETRAVGVTVLDVCMELVTLAEAMARLGALGLGTAIVNVIALRLVRVDEVPGWVQVRIRWWRAHNPAFLMASVAVMLVGLATLAAAAG